MVMVDGSWIFVLFNFGWRASRILDQSIVPPSFTSWECRPTIIVENNSFLIGIFSILKLEKKYDSPWIALFILRPYCTLQNPSPIQQLVVILNSSTTLSALEQGLIIWHDSNVILFRIKHQGGMYLAARRLGVCWVNLSCDEKHCYVFNVCVEQMGSVQKHWGRCRPRQVSRGLKYAAEILLSV